MESDVVVPWWDVVVMMYSASLRQVYVSAGYIAGKAPGFVSTRVGCACVCWTLSVNVIYFVVQRGQVEQEQTKGRSV